MTEKNISLDGIHEQLVDINNGVREFSAVIFVTPPEGEMDKEYNIGIGTQSQIDNKKEISFSAIKGIYKKSFTHAPVNPAGDPDVFYLIMSSQAPVNNIKVHIELIDNGPETYTPPPKTGEQKVEPKVEKKPANKKMLYIKFFIAIVMLTIGGYFLYKFWKKKDDKITPAPGDVFKQSLKFAFPQTQVPAPTVPVATVPVPIVPVTVPVPAVPVTVPVPVPVPVPAVPVHTVPVHTVPVHTVPVHTVPVHTVRAKPRMSVESVDSPIKRVDKPKTGKPTFSFY